MKGQLTRTRLLASSTLRLLFALIATTLLWTAILTHAAAAPATSSDKAFGTSAPSDNPLLLRPRTSFESTILSKQGRPYRILVSCPQGPAPAPGFPVLYVLDADAWLGAAVEIARMREYEKLAPALIVGIAYPSHFFFDPQGRSLDLTPPHSVDPESRAAGLEIGGADQFLSFLDETLKPWVREKYRTDPGSQTLFGHSLGGLFVIHALFKAPASFNTYLAASPSVWFSDKIVLEGEAAFEANPARRRVRVLVTVGELESHPSPALVSDYRRYFSAHPEAIPGQTVSQAIASMFNDSSGSNMVTDARDLTERLARSGVKATFVEFAGEEHMSAAVSALNRGVPFALRPEH